MHSIQVAQKKKQFRFRQKNRLGPIGQKFEQHGGWGIFCLKQNYEVSQHYIL
jgi:invasion protein IalB